MGVPLFMLDSWEDCRGPQQGPAHCPGAHLHLPLCLLLLATACFCPCACYSVLLPATACCCLFVPLCLLLPATAICTLSAGPQPAPSSCALPPCYCLLLPAAADSLPGHILPPIMYPSVLAPGAEAININSSILDVYITDILKGEGLRGRYISPHA